MSLVPPPLPPPPPTNNEHRPAPDQAAPAWTLANHVQVAQMICALAHPELDFDPSEGVDALLRLQCNAHSAGSADHSAMGLGLYPVVRRGEGVALGARPSLSLTSAPPLAPQLSLIGHSCLPSAATSFVGTTARAVAMRDISPGEEVLISYHLEPAPAADRRRVLRQRYNFDCGCERCAAAGPDGGGSEDDLRLARFDFGSLAPPGANQNTRSGGGSERPLPAYG